MVFMPRWFFILLLVLGLAMWASAQQDPAPTSESQQDSKSPQEPSPNPPPPRSDRNAEAGESSSRDTKIDLSPPKDDDKKHPYSQGAVSDEEEATEGTNDVSELHPWDPHKALKDVEVGDFYFKRKNYRAARERYKEALYYKENDAIATFRLAQCEEKLGQRDEARRNYEGYLRILPHGPLSEEAEKSIARLKTQAADRTAVKK